MAATTTPESSSSFSTNQPWRSEEPNLDQTAKARETEIECTLEHWWAPEIAPRDWQREFE
jgi:hypothetical protein